MEAQKLWERLREQVESDEAFRQEMQADPEGVFLRETGMSVTDYQQQSHQLSDEDLGNVSGGGGYLCEWCGKSFSDVRQALSHWFSCPKAPWS